MCTLKRLLGLFGDSNWLWFWLSLWFSFLVLALALELIKIGLNHQDVCVLAGGVGGMIVYMANTIKLAEKLTLFFVYI